jgi:hypothetical protein
MESRGPRVHESTKEKGISDVGSWTRGLVGSFLIARVLQRKQPCLPVPWSR